MTIAVGGLLHVAIVTRDIDAQVRFWTDLFGASAVRELDLDSPAFGAGVGIPGARARTVHLAIPNASATIELTCYEHAVDGGDPGAPADVPGLRHVALRTSDIEGAARELAARGVEIVGGPVVVDQPASVAGTRFLYLRDPDGNLVELVEPAYT